MSLPVRPGLPSLPIRDWGRPLRAMTICLALTACAAPEAQTPPYERLGLATGGAHASYAFARCSATIPRADQQRIHNFLKTRSRRGAGQAIVISVPRACSPQQDEARARQIRSLVGTGYGRVMLIQPEDTQQPGTRGIVRLVQIDAVTVDPHGCDQPGAGCAVANNIAASLADPTELLIPMPTATLYHDPTGNGAKIAAGTATETSQ